MPGEFRLDPLPGEDLDATVEIPVPDFADAGALGAFDQTGILPELSLPASLASTDTHPILSVSAAPEDIAQDLREAEERVARRDDRLVAAELALQAARAAELQLRESRDREIAAERELAQQALEREREQSRHVLQQLQDALLQATQAGTGQSQRVQEFTEQLAQATARADDLAQRLTQQRAELDAEREQSRHALQQAQDALLQATQAGAGQSQRVQELTEQLAQATARADDLALRLTHQRAELDAEREQSRHALQKLQDALLQAMQAGAAQSQRVQELTEQLAQATARADDLALRLTQQRAELDAERANALVVRQRLYEQDVGQAELQRRLDELRSASERQLEALRSQEGYRAISDAQIDQRERQILALESQLLLLQEAEQRHEQERLRLTGELEAAAQRLALEQTQWQGQERAQADLSAQLAALQGQLTAAQASAAEQLAQRERRHAAELAEQRSAFERLQAERASLDEYVITREQELRDAAEQLTRAEADMFQRLSRVEELTRGNDLLSQRLADARRELEARDLRIRVLESQAQSHATMMAGLHLTIQRLGREEAPRPAPAAELPIEHTRRELVLEQDGVVRTYALSRRTTIGRTAENDIMLDTDFISRHHAVLLTSSKHTILEDLNSTNGVRVNGRRITRHVLKDGDTVTIGKTDFRYQVRPAAEADADGAGLP